LQQLKELIAGAQAELEVDRQLQICNACRYCEGFCAVFPAMTRRLEFPFADIHYLANLCHNCGACFHACQYAPPHEFAVNLPRAMAQVRVKTYAEFAWPAPLARLYKRNGLVLALALEAGLSVMLLLVLELRKFFWGAEDGGNFYAVIPHGWMVAMFLPVFAFALLALGIGATRFWRGAPTGAVSGESWREAAGAALSLKYLDGGHGKGCANEDDRYTLARRRWHHFTFYGFMLCFAATTAGTVMHYALGLVAPYGWWSVPKVLGMVGGVSLALGTAGLWQLRQRRDVQTTEPSQQTMDLGFIALLFLVAVSGLVLALARSTPAMPLLLCLHLGAVLAFFATMPYSKFAHGVYRGVALLKWAVERRLPTTLALKGD
jgi:citrate/tricarballylate utilization protein